MTRSAGRGRKYLIDATMIRGGGGFTHLVNTVPELVLQAPEDHFRVLCGSERVAAALPTAPNLDVVSLGEMGLRERFRFTYLGAARYAKQWGADLYFSASEMAPLNAPCPTIAAFQNANVTNMGRGQSLTPKQKLRFRLLNRIARFTARRVDRALFVSDWAAGEMGEALGIPEARRAAIPHGIDPTRWRRDPEAEAQLQPYILAVSSIYPYKNYVRLIEAYAELARQGDTPDLVIVGDNQDEQHYQDMLAAREATGEVAEQIYIVGEVSYDEVHDFYKNASLFVFPSWLESFGIPLLEAMASDTPIVASDLPVFREIARDAALYADPHDPKAIAGAMAEALYVPGAARQLVKAGRERLREYTWQRSASQLLALFRDTVAAR